MSSQERCCPTDLPPFHSDYNPIGKYEKIGNTEVYVTGRQPTERALICTFDVFGMLPNTLQGADILAQSLPARVYVPNFFEKAWPLDDYPPKEGMQALMNHVKSQAPPEKIKAIYISVIEEARADGISKIGSYGFCWGAKHVVINSNLFGAIGLVHPSSLTAEDADRVTVPVALLPSKDEDADLMKKFWDRVPGTVKAKSVFKTFPFHHGFAAARGDFKDPKLSAGAHEAYELLAGLFRSNL